MKWEDIYVFPQTIPMAGGGEYQTSGITKRELFIVIGAAAHAMAHLGNPRMEMVTAQDCYKGGKAFADSILKEMELDSTLESK